MKYFNIREEELKNSVASDFFEGFDCDKIVGFIDFAVKVKRKSSNLSSLEDLTGFNDEYLLWAEAKAAPTDIVAMLTQLVLTIGKARTFDKMMPPPFLGCFDCEKIAFVPYSEIQHIFYQNDFNWKITPSNTETKEFQQVYEQISKILNNDTPWETYIFDFERDAQDLKRFIRENFIVGKSDVSKIKIDKNNFIIIYNKWLQTVKPTIVVDWDAAKRNGIIDGDFYLADLLSQENKTLKEKLFILLKSNYYEANRRIDESGMFASSQVYFSDKQKAHTLFWNKYERPPREEYWDYIVERRDLLVPQDVRERKGSFFTPQIWVELSQRYLADVLGEDWQDEYYVWDCAAGTGNLLAGLTNKYNIWASTLDKQDVDVMHDRIENGANLLHDHVFQFDFLNDDFSKLPQGLQNIINDPEKRKKLVVYINPPYAEAGTGLGRGFKTKVALEHATHDYNKKIGNASNELFAQFFARIKDKIPYSVLAEFSTLKILQAPNFSKFREFFCAEFLKGFVVPAKTFDNVKGEFPIGFMIWNLSEKKLFEKEELAVFDSKGKAIGTKTFHAYSEENAYINDWLRKFHDKKDYPIGILHNNKNDFQHNGQVRITTDDIKDHTTPITVNNLIAMCIYFSVRKVILATWLNDRDQFLYPVKKWEKDLEFQNDCLAYALFNNNIQSKYGVNHWIPFSEQEVNARDKFESHVLLSFLNGKVVPNGYATLFEQLEKKEYVKREFSPAATAVFDAGRELWKYYHGIAGQARNDRGLYNVNASLYDIREHFQERNDKGKMNNTSTDAQYTKLIGTLRDKLSILAKKIEPKVYEYEFLKA
ncbi:hypothetical protein SAMD00024442_14_49 [Candidatus Symbiothrix dinenymphae]|nr:hypothetical protein SAMD00024442_14_49 [Candidatus Symbiothrix dinenymphae]